MNSLFEGFDKPDEHKIFKAHGAQKAAHTRSIRAFRAPRNAENHERRRFCKAFYSLLDTSNLNVNGSQVVFLQTELHDIIQFASMGG